MNDLWLFLGCMLFLFVLWVYTGGPNNPISFSGPYITPVTAPGSTQSGYGPSANTYFRSGSSGGSGISSGGSIAGSARSNYAGTVRIGYSDVRARDARSEYVIIRLESDTDVDITGWRLVGAQSNTTVIIPQGSKGTSSTKRDITLTDDYREAYLVSGSRAADSLKDSFEGTWHAFLGNSRDIWDDDSDTLTLFDGNGKVVDQYSY